MNNERHYASYRAAETKPGCPQVRILDPFILASHSKEVAPDNAEGILHNAKEVGGHAVSKFMDDNDGCLE